MNKSQNYYEAYNRGLDAFQSGLSIDEGMASEYEAFKYNSDEQNEENEEGFITGYKDAESCRRFNPKAFKESMFESIYRQSLKEDTNTDSPDFKEGYELGIELCEQGINEDDIVATVESEYDQEQFSFDEWENFFDGVHAGYYDRQSQGDGN